MDLNNLNFDTKLLSLKIRKHVLEMTSRGGSSHIGSCLSIADILAVLYGKVLKIDPNNPDHPLRDRFILSKGHAGAAVYATLAETGFFNPDKLKNHYQNGSVFSGHVSHKGIPGVEISTGSLGHGLGVGAGMALAAKKCQKTFRVFVLMSDGECDEGSNWETIMFASHFRLSNLIAIIDYNKLQSLRSTTETLDLEPFREKWESFGWDAIEIDGHNHSALLENLYEINFKSKKPKVFICNTVKGKGISFMENNVLWHYRSPQGEEFEKAMNEIKP